MGLEQEFYGRKIDKQRSVNLNSGLCLADRPEFKRPRNRMITRSVDLKTVLLIDREGRGEASKNDLFLKDAARRHCMNMAASIARLQ